MSTVTGSARERILAATLELLQSGRTEVRLEDIAKAAGVSRQTVYVQFGSRAALFVETAKYLDQQAKLAERVAAYRNAPDGRSMLREFVAFWTSYIPVVYPLARVLLAAYETDDAARAAWDDRMEDFRRGCARVAARLSEEGMLAKSWTTEHAADILYGVLSIHTWAALTRERGWTHEQYVAGIERVAHDTLLGGDAAPPG